MPETVRLAMWSGPRNISTAMMRAFGNRADCTVSDEPLYGAWLAASGADHPLREEIIAAMDTDWQHVVANLTGAAPDGKPLWYQKHMTHHLLPEMWRGDWLARLTHAFLIRDPAAVVASYLRQRGSVTPEAIGMPQQRRLFRFVRRELGQEPPIIDAGEFLTDPEGHLRALCTRLDLTFTEAMLAWPAGPRSSDGVWAVHWYRNVWASTGFAPAGQRPVALSPAAERVAEQCLADYRYLFDRRLIVEPGLSNPG